MGTVKYSGPVASFHCPTNAEIRSLKVHFSPKQLGEGDPNPENVRPISGWDGIEIKQSQNNLLDGQWLAEKIAASGGTIDNIAKTIVYSGSVANSTGIILDKFNYGKYTIIAKFTSTNSNSNLNMRVSYSDNSELLLSTSNAVEIGTNIYKFTTAINKQISSIKCSWIAGTTTLYFDIFGIYEGDINNFEPYHGSTTNYEFGVLGKNKLPITTNMEIKSINTGYDNTLQRDMTPGILYPNVSANNYWLGTSAKTFVQEVQNGSITFQANDGSYGIGTFVSVQPQVTYTISYTTSDNQVRMRIGCYDVDGYFTGTHQIINNGASFTIPNDVYYMIIVVTPNADYYNQEITVSNLQLELGSTATEYEPYDPNKTVYGGWVDLITGEVQEEWATKVLGTVNWNSTRLSATDSIAFYSTISDMDATKGVICTHYKSVGNSSIGYLNNNEICSYIVTSSGSSRLGIRDDSKETLSPADFKEAMLDVTVIYPLIAPITHSLAPISMQTFLSANNVWSNADYVEVEYDLHETQTILARKQFIIANQPHLEEASGGITTFNTDMKAPLKECKAYFSPV